MPYRLCRPLAGDGCQIAEPKPGSSGRSSCNLGLSRAQRQPRLPLDARRAAPLPRPRVRGTASQQANNFREPAVVLGNSPVAGPSSRPTSCGHPQTDRRAGNDRPASIVSPAALQSGRINASTIRSVAWRRIDAPSASMPARSVTACARPIRSGPRLCTNDISGDPSRRLREGRTALACPGLTGFPPNVDWRTVGNLV